MVSLFVTFAVKEESHSLQRLIGQNSTIRVLLTGIGQRNAERAIRQELATMQPKLVLTCGFAGGLNPALAAGTVIFSADADATLSPALLAAGARPVGFHCVERVVTTVGEKRALRHHTGADAVEMESGIIRRICREARIPSATVRVISDTADEDLPLDFNRLMDAEQNLSFGKLALALVASPGRIGALLKLRKQTRLAAERLAVVLFKAVSDPALAGAAADQPQVIWPSLSRCS
jgi:adenosylhomocysteine nucleosidase